MKIVVLQDDFPPHHVGGGGIIAYQLAKEFVRMGHQVLVITTVQEKQLAGIETMEGMEVARIFCKYHPRFRAYKSVYNRIVLREAARLLKACAPDIVHVHNVHTYLSYFSLTLARKFGRKVVMTEHDAMSFHFGKLRSVTDASLRALPKELLTESFSRQLLMHVWRFNPMRTPVIKLILRKNVDATVAVSNALAEALEANGIGVREVIHNGISVPDWRATETLDAFKRAHNLGNQVILFGGRLSEPKGAIAMLEAMPAIVKSVPEAQLLVIGKSDAFVERMRSLSASLGVGKRVIFTGWICGADLNNAYHASRVVAVPSLYLDPFPTVNLEAFASGKPVVASCFGGSSELVENNVSGFVVNPLNTKVLSEKVILLLEDEITATRFGAAGRKRVEAEFTLSRAAAQYESLFRSLL